MAPVSIKYRLDAQHAMLRGINLLADTVGVTLGPCGRTVLIEAGQANSVPRITKDGVTVADTLELAGRYEQMGLRLIRRAGQRVGEEFGDGTTTTILLARALAAEGLKAIAAGYDPMALRLAIRRGVSVLVAELQRKAQPLRGREDFDRIATISANGEVALAVVISEAFESVGAEGVVSVEAGEAFHTTWLKLSGLQWGDGYISPYFMTDAATTECRYNNPLILLTEHRLENHAPLLKPLEAAVRAKRPLLIVAEDVIGEALQTLIVNKIKNNLRVVAAKGPLFGDRRRDALQDLAVVTGATLVSDRRGDDMSVIDPAVLGGAERIVLTKDRTTIIGGEGDLAAVALRAESIRADQGLKGNTPFQEKVLRERLAKLTGGVAVVRVGGASQTEIGERRDRAEDATSALRAAAVDGILPGGGTAYVHAARVLADEGSDEARAATRILRRALAAPAMRIAKNSGYDGPRTVALSAENENPRHGFDAQIGIFGDLMEFGIVDPARVVIAALEAANSVATLFLTVEAVVAKPPAPTRPTKADDIPFGPEAKDMTPEEAGGFGLV
ncbi:MAG: chaperonin GroEL [Pseudomonadota bacterium]|nr:chaperonin GroEL [Pseudomonadota bacterium]